MSDLSRAAVGLFAVLAAPGALALFAAFAPSAPSSRLRLVAAVGSLAFAVLAVAGALGEPVLDWLDVSAENFQLAGGIVMLPLAFRLLWWGESGAPTATQPFWRASSLMLGPVPVVLMLSYSARFGFGTALGAAAVALLASGLLLMAGAWVTGRLGQGGSALLGRFNGALIVVLAVELMVDGVQSV